MSTPYPQQPKLRLKDRRRRLMWIKVAAGTAVVAVAFVLLFYTAHLPSVTISEVTVRGTDLVNADTVQAVVEKQLAGSYFYVIPHANAFVAPSSSIKNAIVAAFPPVASVSITHTSLTKMDIVITERKPTALWCSGSAPADGDPVGSTPCYLMDKGGFVYATSTHSDPLVRYYGELSENPVGKTFLSGGFASLGTIVAGITDSIHRTPATVAVDSASPDVSLTFAEGGVLRFERTADAQSAIQNIASVFASQSFKDHPHFEYVDFRFGDKVYVKFK